MPNCWCAASAISFWCGILYNSFCLGSHVNCGGVVVVVEAANGAAAHLTDKLLIHSIRNEFDKYFTETSSSAHWNVMKAICTMCFFFCSEVLIACVCMCVGVGCGAVFVSVHLPFDWWMSRIRGTRGLRTFDMATVINS